jgi:uncharacterized damage-inducible protein DinB
VDSRLLRTQLEYSFHASLRTVEALRRVPDADLRRDRGNSHGGLLDTLAHIYCSDRVWLSRAVGKPRTTLADPGESWSLDILEAGWQHVARQWFEWTDSVEDVRAKLAYRSLSGQPFELPMWQMVFHVVNHATYHRGQITTMLRQAGYAPVPTDLHTFYLTAAK